MIGIELQETACRAVAGACDGGADLHGRIWTLRAGGAVAGIDEAARPQRRRLTTIGVKGVNRVVSGGDEDHVVKSAADFHASEIQRLAKNIAIDGVGEELSEIAGVDIGSRERDLTHV